MPQGKKKSEKEETPVQQSEREEKQKKEETSQSQKQEETQEETQTQEEGLGTYQPKHRPLQAAGLDQHAVEESRQAEKTAQREEHNERTGDVSR